MHLSEFLGSMPLIAVLRYIKPEDAIAIGDVLVEAGIVCLEVPMNSPNPCESMEKLAKAYGPCAFVAAGTVIDPADVKRIANAGGQMIISPHTDVDVIKEAKRRGLYCIPGFVTPTEAFMALKAGADALKLFPAEGNSPGVLKALRAILPKDIAVIPTGGITPEKMVDYVTAGANGFGLGGALYQPGDSPEIVAKKARCFVKAIKEIKMEIKR